MIERLIKGIATFSKNNCFINSPYNKNVEKGQSAKILVIGCADSLVDPFSLTSAKPGELFIHRNIAGLVPPFNSREDNIHATSAVLDYGVNNLQVSDIIVLGHGHCGGIKALLKNQVKKKKNSYAESWMEIARPALNKIVKNNISDAPDQQRNLCEKEAIKVSLQNLGTFPFIIEKLSKNKINLHGWHFDRGTLSIYNENRWEVKVKNQL